MIKTKTAFGILKRTLSNKISHISTHKDYDSLIKQEAAIAMMLIDQGYEIIDTKTSYKEESFDFSNKEFSREVDYFQKIMKFNRLVKHPIVKKHADNLIRLFNKDIENHFVKEKEEIKTQIWQLEFKIKHKKKNK